MRVFEKPAIGIISSHSLQHPPGYHFLCDSTCAGGLSGWNAQLVSGGMGLCMLWPLLHSTPLWNEFWLHLGLFFFHYDTWDLFTCHEVCFSFCHLWQGSYISILSAPSLWTPWVVLCFSYSCDSLISVHLLYLISIFTTVLFGEDIIVTSFCR